MSTDPRLLLIDTCGETPGVAISAGSKIVATEDLSSGSASAQIVSALRRLTDQSGLGLSGLDAIGVVRGPGSFTGMRAGLAAAKGLCEATNLPLVAVSRLKVLAEAASAPVSFAALDAGRGELYIRDLTTSHESLHSIQTFRQIAVGEAVVVAEARIDEQLASTCTTLIRALHVTDALRVVLQALQATKRESQLAASDILIDANYIRQENDIYSKPRDRSGNVKSAGA